MIENSYVTKVMDIAAITELFHIAAIRVTAIRVTAIRELVGYLH